MENPHGWRSWPDTQGCKESDTTEQHSTEQSAFEIPWGYKLYFLEVQIVLPHSNSECQDLITDIGLDEAKISRYRA